MIIQLVTNKMLLKRSNDLYWLLNSIIWKVASVVPVCDHVITKLLSYFVRKHHEESTAFGIGPPEPNIFEILESFWF